jgi:hypothetical protein
MSMVQSCHSRREEGWSTPISSNDNDNRGKHERNLAESFFPGHRGAGNNKGWLETQPAFVLICGGERGI